MRARFFCCVAALVLLSGCSVNPGPGVIQVGMPFDAAVKAVEAEGASTYQVAASALPPGENLQARRLKSGKVVVLQGNATLQSIEVLENPDQPKLHQKLTFVDRYSVR